MRVYVIEVRRNGIDGRISQEGYSSLEKAQAFIATRSGPPQKISAVHYRVETRRNVTDYLIHDILVQ